MFRQFCQKFIDEGILAVYKCDELKTEEFLQENIREKYALLWDDFVLIRIHLFNGKLRQLFEKKLNVKKSTLEKFYKYFSCYRILCVTLPINSDDCNVPKLYHGDNRNPWLEMIEKFNVDYDVTATRTSMRRKEFEIEMFSIGDLNHIYRFCLLWNGVFVMMQKWDANYEYGLLIKMRYMELDGCVINRNDLFCIFYFFILHKMCFVRVVDSDVTVMQIKYPN